MEKKDDLIQLKAELLACKKEIKTIEVSDEQPQLLSSQLPDIDIKSLLFD